MRALLILSVLGIASPAFAEDTFDAAASSAVRVKRIDDAIWALTAKCDQGTDTQQRQCRHLRDTRAAELKGSTLLVDADREAFNVGAWNAAKKSASLTVTACVRCSGIDVDGKSWFVAGTREANQPPRFQGGRQTGALLNETSRTFPDAASAKKFADSVANAKVQFVVRVPANATWTDTNRQGIAFEVVAFRVYSPCDGSIVVSNPKSGAGEVDKRACAGLPPAGAEVEQLTPAMIKETLRPALEAAKACGTKYSTSGKGKLKLAIDADGKITSTSLEGELAGSEAAKCIDEAAKAVSFPRSKKPHTQCAVPIELP